jgi:hypothetical protein
MGIVKSRIYFLFNDAFTTTLFFGREVLPARRVKKYKIVMLIDLF